MSKSQGWLSQIFGSVTDVSSEVKMLDNYYTIRGDGVSVLNFEKAMHSGMFKRSVRNLISSADVDIVKGDNEEYQSLLNPPDKDNRVARSNP